MVNNIFINHNKITPTKNENQVIKHVPMNCANGNSLKASAQEMKKVAAGLKNMGNTCFLNSTLQCLLHTKPLFDYLQSESHENCRLNKFCMVCELRQLVRRCFAVNASSVSPDSILRNLKAIAGHMKWGRQEDAHEFLRYVIEAINKSFPKSKSKDGSDKKSTVAETIFQGDLESQIKCLHCQHTSTKCDPFLDVCLDVKNVPSIEAGLQRFTSPETLQGGNAYKCSSCKKMVKARKMFRLGRLPKVFTVQLKRYSMFGGKVSNHVSFPERLNLSPYVSDQSASRKASTEYDLYAVLVHEGRSTNSGHYYCHVRVSNDKWFCMNDSHVSSIDVQQVLKSQAYILFYLQKTKKLEGSGKQKETQSYQNGYKEKEPEFNEDKTLHHQKLKPSKSLDSLNIVGLQEKPSLNRSLQLDVLDDDRRMDGINGSMESLPSLPSEPDGSFEVKEQIIEQPAENKIKIAEHSQNGTKSLTSPTATRESVVDVEEKVREVWFTSRWIVEAMRNDSDDDDDSHMSDEKFKSTSAWRVEHDHPDNSVNVDDGNNNDDDDKNIDMPEAEPIADTDEMKNGFSCPTFDWDEKRAIVVPAAAEANGDEELEEELAKKKLTFGRQILTWGGQQSMMDANSERKISNRKRKWEELNEEIDRGKAKMKKKKHSRSIGSAFQNHADVCYSKNVKRS